jgi:leucyl-tRNA synthetase
MILSAVYLIMLINNSKILHVFCHITFLFILIKAKSEYLKETTIVLPVQINGKTRGTIKVEKGCSEEDAFKLASTDEKLCKYFKGGEIKKRIYVPGRILNIIVVQQKVARS